MDTLATTTISVTLPRTLLTENGISLQAASNVLLQTFVLALYRRDRISTGKAAHLLGMSRLAFIGLLATEQIAYLDYTPEELLIEAQVLQPWTPNPR